MNSQVLSGKTIIITGGSRGIGRVVAEHCIEAGGSVVIGARTAPESLPIRTAFLPCDVTSQAQVENLVKETVTNHGKVDALVACAGISGGIGKFYELPLDGWQRAFDTNVMGVLHSVRSVVPSMKKQGGGRIVLFGGAGQGSLPRRSAYAATKGAIARMTETFADELKEDSIYLNSVLPGPVVTHFVEEVIRAGPERATQREYDDAVRLKAGGGTPPQLVAKLILYLLSGRSGELTGKTLSARWDRYEEFGDLQKMNESDIYTMRRVIKENGETR